VQAYLDAADAMRTGIRDSTVAVGMSIREEVLTTSKLLRMCESNDSSAQGLQEIKDALAYKQEQSLTSAATAVRTSPRTACHSHLRRQPSHCASEDAQMCLHQRH
jgi:hypothetical protein